VLSLLLAALLSAAPDPTASVWRDFMPGPGPERPNGVMVAVDLPESLTDSSGRATHVTLRHGEDVWTSPLRFTYFVDSTLPEGRRIARYHSAGRDGPVWPVGDAVDVTVMAGGKWIAGVHKVKIGRTD
jgi:hypothetical protein